jgi:hypothetical protein
MVISGRCGWSDLQGLAEHLRVVLWGHDDERHLLRESRRA